MKNFWKIIGKGFLFVAKGAVTGAKWASDHPEVLQGLGAVATAAGAPSGVVVGVERGVAIAGAVAKAKDAK